MATPSAAREGGDDGKVKLYLAKPTPAALAELYQRLTGKPLSAEGLKQLREIMRKKK